MKAGFVSLAVVKTVVYSRRGAVYVPVLSFFEEKETKHFDVLEKERWPCLLLAGEPSSASVRAGADVKKAGHARTGSRTAWTTTLTSCGKTKEHVEGVRRWQQGLRPPWVSSLSASAAVASEVVGGSWTHRSQPDGPARACMYIRSETPILLVSYTTTSTRIISQ